MVVKCITHTHPSNGPFPGLPRWAGTRKVTPIWIFVKQETVSGSGISWAMCKSAPCSRQITMPAPHHSVFLEAGCPSCRPTNSVKALKCIIRWNDTRWPCIISSNDTRSTVTRWSFDTDQRHVMAFWPISEAAHSWSYDKITCYKKQLEVSKPVRNSSIWMHTCTDVHTYAQTNGKVENTLTL